MTRNRRNIKHHQQFKKWNFGTINIRTGGEKSEGAKMYAVTKEIAKANLLFCCLQEVRWRGIDSKIIQLDTGEKYEFHWCGHKKKREEGVGILIKVHPDIEISTPDYNDPRVIINIKVHGLNLRVVNGYAPTDANGTDKQKQLFYSQLRKAAVKTQKHQKLIVTGDFNATTSIAKHRCFFDGKKVIQDPECSDNGTHLKTFCQNHELCISSTYFKHRMLHRYTWYSNDGKTRKINDYILAEQYVQQYLTDCRVYRSINIESDHRLLKATIRAPTTRKKFVKQQIKNN